MGVYNVRNLPVRRRRPQLFAATDGAGGEAGEGTIIPSVRWCCLRAPLLSFALAQAAATIATTFGHTPLKWFIVYGQRIFSKCRHARTIEDDAYESGCSWMGEGETTPMFGPRSLLSEEIRFHDATEGRKGGCILCEFLVSSMGSTSGVPHSGRSGRAFPPL